MELDGTIIVVSDLFRIGQFFLHIVEVITSFNVDNSINNFITIILSISDDTCGSK